MISPAEKVQGVGERKREERVRACLSILPLIDSSIRVRARRHGAAWGAHRSKKSPRKAAATALARIGAFSGCRSFASKATTTPWTALKFYCEKDASATSRSGSHEYLLRTESERVTSFILGERRRESYRVGICDAQLSTWHFIEQPFCNSNHSSEFICMNKEITHS